MNVFSKFSVVIAVFFSIIACSDKPPTDVQLNTWLADELNNTGYQINSVDFDIEPILLSHMPNADAYRATFRDSTVQIEEARYEQDSVIKSPSGVVFIRESVPAGKTFHVNGYIEAATNGKAWIHNVRISNELELKQIIEKTLPREGRNRRHVLVGSDEYKTALDGHLKQLEETRQRKIANRKTYLTNISPFVGSWRYQDGPRVSGEVYKYRRFVIDSDGNLSIGKHWRYQRAEKLITKMSKYNGKILRARKIEGGAKAGWSELTIKGRWSHSKERPQSSLRFRLIDDNTIEASGSSHRNATFVRAIDDDLIKKYIINMKYSKSVVGNSISKIGYLPDGIFEHTNADQELSSGTWKIDDGILTVGFPSGQYNYLFSKASADEISIYNEENIEDIFLLTTK